MTTIFQFYKLYIIILFISKKYFKCFLIIVLTKLISTTIRTFFTAKSNAWMPTFKHNFARFFARPSWTNLKTFISASRMLTTVFTGFNALFAWLSAFLRTFRVRTFNLTILNAWWAIWITFYILTFVIANIYSAAFRFAFSVKHFSYALRAFIRTRMTAFQDLIALLIAI